MLLVFPILQSKYAIAHFERSHTYILKYLEVSSNWLVVLSQCRIYGTTTAYF
ncbi:hypothetical protein [Calothrix sp. UHCC 0171]|uniref:hypothetical protein n=1 Tax=Calothrix sp. UHCC 0171 TaxID=3110245 RepID=UPI002B1E92EE|nr:hypothetical protein [Calothrix sp. UHCC 0171]MEA5572279.1 hypothetical protein [Calothrix sp. UHCC 0171]